MSGEADTLLVDAGNTNVKYCLLSHSGELKPLNSNQDVSAIMSKNDSGIGIVALCSVRSVQFSKQLQAQCETESIDFFEIKTEPQSVGIKCAYQNYRTLGVDRWMIILAVAGKTQGPVLAVSIGTAITVDYINEGQHIGGWITPGFDLAKHALFKNTTGVFGNDRYPDNIDFKDNTEECVNSGCLALVNGLILQAVKHVNSLGLTPEIIVTGGGRKLLSKSSFPDLEEDDLLIFKGMKRYTLAHINDS